MPLNARIAWAVATHPALPPWLVFLLWVPFAFRASLRTGIATVGLLDDLLLLTGGVTCLALLERVPRWLRSASLLIAGVFLVTVHLSSLVYFRFYRAFIGRDALSMAGEAGDAASIVEASLNETTLLLTGVAPLLLLLAAMIRAASYGRRRTAPLGFIAAIGFVVLAISRSTLASDFFVAAETNPVAFLARDALRFSLPTQKPDANVARMAIIARRDETYHRSPDYVWADSFEYPLLKTPISTREAVSQPRYNVALILLESVRGLEGGLIGRPGGSPVAPHLSRLAREALVFPNVYFNASQTAPGEVATLCSLLPDMTMEVLYLDAPQLSVACLPEILRRAGYSTLWINSYRADFTNRDEFLSSHGFSKLFAEREIRAWGPKRPPIGWGIADEDLFDFALNQLDRTVEPFFSEILTLSNHAPQRPAEFPVSEDLRDVSATENYQGYLLGTRYTDHALGAFLTRARTRPWFPRTLFVILGDHGIWVFPAAQDGAQRSFLEKTEMYLRAGMMIWAPGIVEPGLNPAVGSQIDVAPTVLDLLGVAAPNAFQGVSLVEARIPPEGRYAVYVGKSSWGIRQGTKYCYALGQSCFDSVDPRCPPGLSARPAAHSCFAAPGDLLDPANRGEFALLDDDARSRLLAIGERLLGDTTFLVQSNSVSPETRPRDTPSEGIVAPAINGSAEGHQGERTRHPPNTGQLGAESRRESVASGPP